ncbi:hypothetical protein [Kribbella sp. NPDC048915]
MEPLQALGVSAPAETLYLDLLQNPGTPSDVIAAATVTARPVWPS